MEPLKHLLLLLPGYELDEFPRHTPSDEAKNLLSGWIGMWHPWILQNACDLPAWQSASSVPPDLGKSVIVIPEISKTAKASDWDNEPEATFLEPDSNWRDFQSKIILELARDSAAELMALSAEWRSDFAALGYTYLQVQLMTRQMRYTSNLDQALFAEQVRAAAESADDPSCTQTEELLQACFDTLGQERDHFYSLDVHLLDVTLLAESTLGKRLHTQLKSGGEHGASAINSPPGPPVGPPTTYLANADILKSLSDHKPETFALLRERVSSQDALAGGLTSERPHPLMNREALARDLFSARTKYKELGVEPPKVFSRLSFGVHTDNALELRRFGFDGVFLQAWTEGSYPVGSQPKIGWESQDGTFISAIASEVLDANDPSSFLALGWTVGEALDRQHVPTVLFAHWPQQKSEFVELLNIASRRTTALGRWINCNDYFKDTDEPYHQERLVASSFKYNWLAKAKSANRLNEQVRAYHILASRCRSLQNLANLAWQFENAAWSQADDEAKAATTLQTGGSDQTQSTEEQGGTQNEPPSASPEPQVSANYGLADSRLTELQALSDCFFDSQGDAWIPLFDEAKQLADRLETETVQRLAIALKLPQGRETNENSHRARLLLNPRSFPQRIRVQSQVENSLAAGEWNYATGQVGNDRYTAVDVSGLGFLCAPIDRQSVSPERQVHLAEIGGTLQNEFLEAQIDTSRGLLRSLHVPGRRGNRLSVQIARRDRDDKSKFIYAEMKATKVQMLTSSNMCGLIRASGHLILNKKKVASYEIDYELWRGSRILEVAIRLSDLSPNTARNPWKSAYVLRVAWPTESAILYTSTAGRRSAWTGQQVASPHLIEIDETDYKTQILTGGLAFHRRTEERFLESILVTEDENKDNATFEHRMGIGVDLPYPTLAAEDFVDQRYALTVHAAKPIPVQNGWFISADRKNVRIDVEAPLVTEQGKTIGVRLFLAEMQGTSTSTKIRLMGNVASARRVDYLGEELGTLNVEGDTVSIVLRGNEQTNVDILWG
ncbi:MAG: hypothetical protein AB8B50_10960 [Pirellulaceae bacterium]